MALDSRVTACDSSVRYLDSNWGCEAPERPLIRTATKRPLCCPGRMVIDPATCMPFGFGSWAEKGGGMNTDPAGGRSRDRDSRWAPSGRSLSHDRNVQKSRGIIAYVICSTIFSPTVDSRLAPSLSKTTMKNSLARCNPQTSIFTLSKNV